MIYTVKSWDNLPDIANLYDMTEERLREDNGLAPGQPLVPGQALVILRPAETYTVRQGDTLYGIAAKTGLSLFQLLRNNPGAAAAEHLHPGERLVLRYEEGEPFPLRLGGYAYPHNRADPLRRALPFLDTLSVFSYGFREDGSLVVPDDSRLLAEAERFGTVPVLVFTSVDEEGVFSDGRASRLFHSPAMQERVGEALISVMKEKGYKGIDADFEYIAPEDAESYHAWLGGLRDRMQAEGFFLHVDLAPKSYAEQPGLLYEAHNYPIIGAIADRVLIMTYEWGYAYGPPMAVAPLPQVTQVLRYAVTEIPSWKVEMGLPNYGYDWTLPYEKGRRAVTLGNEEAVRLAAEAGVSIQFDEEVRSPFFQYVKNGESHVVWFEDARSIGEKLALARSLSLRGGTYWNLLRPFAQSWALVSDTVRVIRD